jgi:hypothetical protein
MIFTLLPLAEPAGAHLGGETDMPMPIISVPYSPLAIVHIVV